MKVILPLEVKNCISKIGNKTAQKNGYKIYAKVAINTLQVPSIIKPSIISFYIFINIFI